MSVKIEMRGNVTSHTFLMFLDPERAGHLV
jgi:hypothetical protein